MPLTKKKAVSFLGLDEKVFDNFFKNAGEFSALPRPKKAGRFMFDQRVLADWLASYRWRSIELTKADYALCLDFALAMHFKGYVMADWGSSRQREFGQKITNWVKGQLGEVAVKKFLFNNFALEVGLDFEVRNKIVPQDIIEVQDNGHARGPNIGVGIKSSKPKSAFLVIGENEFTIKARRSDVYIFCRPNIPDDHLIRITKKGTQAFVRGQQHYAKYVADMKDFENIWCEVAGWCERSDLRRVKSIPGQPFVGYRYVIESGNLNKSKESWQKLVDRL